MHYDPRSHFFAKAPFIEFNPEAIKNCVNLLTPDTVNITLMDHKLSEEDLNKVLPWYKTKYSCEDIPEAWISDWKNAKPLPDFDLSKLKNPFIPDCELSQEFESSTKVSDIPRKIFQNETIEVWQSSDSQSNQYECHFAVDVISPFFKESIES